MRFNSHGSYDIKLEQNILVIDGHGPFNDEITKLYQQDISVALDQIDKANVKCGCLIKLYEMCLFTPEAEAILTEVIKHRQVKGVLFTAYVLLDKECDFIVKEQMIRAATKAKSVFKFFSDAEHAKHWLNERLNEQV